ncbi:response regulator [Flavobacterium sp. Arc2]|jgi:two-component system sensor histidine kinase/response regulator|uniref:ATP-binding response regulator n=1 Tax=Flavobacterium sp. Arc2 TaxID=3046685 RepID=UPI00352E59E1
MEKVLVKRELKIKITLHVIMIKNKILLIDDDLTLRETIHEVFSIKNYDVVSVSNGQEALDLLDNWIPDLIICDIMMPVMDGFLFHETVKEVKSLSAVPFIFLTAKKEYNLMRKCLLMGADDFLNKPFVISVLINLVETKIDRFKKIKTNYNNLYVGEKKYLVHEINTALNGILPIINILRDDRRDFNKEKINELHDIIKLSGDRLNRTMSNLFLYQNFIDNELEFLENSESKIVKSISKVKVEIQRLYEDSEERIVFKIKEADIKISQKYLDFILFELIENALKFSFRSTVVVTGVPFEDRYYKVVIQDSGIGFSEDELKKIDAGKQFNREIREQQGLGLGLFLSKTILKKSKGVFSITSTENKGTEITLFFPM